MISLNLKKAFEELDIAEKRDAISNELMFIGELLKKIKLYNGIESELKIKNYDLNSKLEEEEFLTFIYDDIFEVQKQLLEIITNIKN